MLNDTRITTHDGANVNYTEFAEGGLYTADFSSNVNGNYTNGFAEFVHESEDGVQTTFGYRNQAKSGIDSKKLTINQHDKLQIKATVDKDCQEHNIKLKLAVSN